MRLANGDRCWSPCGLKLHSGWFLQCLKKCRRQQKQWPEPAIIPNRLEPRDEKSNRISMLPREGEGGILHSGLSRLPLEIRQEIYGYVLGREENNFILLSRKKVHAIRGAPPIPYQDLGPYRGCRRHNGIDPAFWIHRPAILRTCRQIYREAVDLLYTGNTFVFQSPFFLFAFANAVLPYRFNAIRKIRICYEQLAYPFWSPSISRQLDPPSRDLMLRQEWRQSWTTIAGMPHLTTLHVTLDGRSSGCWLDASAHWDLLLPLLDLRGIGDFKLWFGVPVYCPVHGMTKWRDVRMTDQLDLKTLVERIMRDARLPRVLVAAGSDAPDRRSLVSGPEQKTAESGIGDDEIGPPSSPRQACGCERELLYEPIILGTSCLGP